MSFMDRLISHLNMRDPNVPLFLKFVIPEFERGAEIFRVYRRPAKYLFVLKNQNGYLIL